MTIDGDLQPVEAPEKLLPTMAAGAPVLFVSTPRGVAFDPELPESNRSLWRAYVKGDAAATITKQWSNP